MKKGFDLIENAALLLATCFILLPAAARAAADVQAEITTAGTHAGLASKAGTVKMAHTHLHHTLNCLVGPKGTGFDASELNPCAKSGDGAIPDTADAAQKRALQAVVAKAESGIKEDDLASSQHIAVEVSTMLKAIQ